jgi:hypothetical protein
MARIEMPSAAIATVSPLPFQVTVKMIFPLFLVSLCTRHLTKSATGEHRIPADQSAAKISGHSPRAPRVHRVSVLPTKRFTTETP